MGEATGYRVNKWSNALIVPAVIALFGSLVVAYLLLLPPDREPAKPPPRPDTSEEVRRWIVSQYPAWKIIGIDQAPIRGGLNRAAWGAPGKDGRELQEGEKGTKQRGPQIVVGRMEGAY